MSKYLLAVCFGLLFFIGGIFADASADPEASQAAAGDEAKPSWTDKVKWYGDFRYRHETIDEEDKDTRHRHRIRARIGIKADLTDSFNLDFRLASGSSDPISTNQTLTGGFSTKQINLDLAYFDFHPAQAKGMNITGGKIQMPFHVPQKTQLIWDSDLNPEGAALKFKRSMENVNLFLNAAGFWVEERSSQPDSGMFGLQGGVEFKIPDTSAYVTGGLSYFDYMNAEGFKPFYDAGDSFGNSVTENEDGDVVYLDDFNLVEAFFETGTEARGIPIGFFADYVNNTAADAHNQGWLVGVTAGKGKDPGTLKGFYNYRDLERDAVVGAFTDSDFGGGGTDVKGHKMGLGIGIAKNVSAGLTYFNNTLAPGTDSERNYQRFQADLEFKF